MALENNKNHNNFKIDESDQSRLYLALSSHELSIKEQDTCPDDETLSLLVQRKLSSNKRKLLLSHIDNCPTCYENLLQIPLPATKEKEIFSLSTYIFSFIEGIIECIKDYFFRPKYVLVPALAVATCCIIIVITTKIYHIKDLNSAIEHSYKIVMNQSISKYKLIFPWEHHQKGLISPVKITPEKKAFVAGLMKGRKEFIQSSEKEYLKILEKWKHPDDDKLKSLQIYYWIGKWALLIQSLKYNETPLAETFWKDQLSIIKSMLNELKTLDTHDARFLKTELLKINKEIEGNTYKDPIIKQKKISQKISFFIERFSPKQLF